MAFIENTDNNDDKEQGLTQPTLGGEQSDELSQGTISSTQNNAGSSERKGTTAGSRLQNLQ